MRAVGVISVGAVIASLAGGVAGVGLAGHSPRTDTVAIGDTITLRLRRADRRGRLAQLLEIRRLSDGDIGRGSFVRGRPLFDPDNQPVAVVPWAIAAARARDRDRNTDVSDHALRDAERFLARLERTGRTRSLRRLSFIGYRGRKYSPVISRDSKFAIPSDEHAREFTEVQTRRRFLVGDDQTWRDYRAGDTTALERLTGEDAGLRFRMREDGRSEFQALPHRRVLLRRSARYVTLVPELPTRSNGHAAGLEWDSLYEIRLPGRSRLPVTSAISSLGAVIRPTFDALRFRTPAPEFRNFPHDQPAEAFAPRGSVDHDVLNVTPPSNETHVPIDLDWEAPLATGSDQRGPAVRFRFSHPLDPDVVPTLHLTRTGVGSLSERRHYTPVPIETELEQSHLGDVVLTIRPSSGTLLPSAAYEVRLRNWHAFGGRPAYRSTDYGSRFTTEPMDIPREEVTVDFDGFYEGDWHYGVDPEDNTAFASLGITEFDPDGRGLVVPDRDLSASVWHTSWHRFDHTAPTLSAVLDDPSTEEIEGSIVTAGDLGTSVEIQVRAAPSNSETLERPSLLLGTAWTPIDRVADISGRQWVQFRILFTVDATVPPDARMPSVDRISIESEAEPALR